MRCCWNSVIIQGIPHINRPFRRIYFHTTPTILCDGCFPHPHSSAVVITCYTSNLECEVNYNVYKIIIILHLQVLWLKLGLYPLHSLINFHPLVSELCNLTFSNPALYILKFPVVIFLVPLWKCYFYFCMYFNVASIRKPVPNPFPSSVPLPCNSSIAYIHPVLFSVYHPLHKEMQIMILL
jgi:hypothetical protein